MNKSAMIEALIHALGAKGPEAARLRKHHAARTLSQVRESLQRWTAVNRTTKAECARHCITRGLRGQA